MDEGFPIKTSPLQNRGMIHFKYILGLHDDKHSIWDLWTSDLEDCKGDFLLESSRMGKSCWSGFFLKKKLGGIAQGCWTASPNMTPPSPHDGVMAHPVGAHPNGMRSSPIRVNRHVVFIY